MSIMLRHDHSYQISVSVKNVGLLIGPLSVKSKDPGSLCKDSLFYWKKNFALFLRLGSDIFRLRLTQNPARLGFCGSCLQF